MQGEGTGKPAARRSRGAAGAGAGPESQAGDRQRAGKSAGAEAAEAGIVVRRSTRKAAGRPDKPADVGLPGGTGRADKPADADLPGGELATGKPAAKEPAAEKPAARKAKAEKTATGKAATRKPAAGGSAADEPPTGKTAQEPAAGAAAAAKPGKGKAASARGAAKAREAGTAAAATVGAESAAAPAADQPGNPPAAAAAAPGIARGSARRTPRKAAATLGDTASPVADARPDAAVPAATAPSALSTYPRALGPAGGAAPRRIARKRSADGEKADADEVPTTASRTAGPETDHAAGVEVSRPRSRRTRNAVDAEFAADSPAGTPLFQPGYEPRPQEGTRDRPKVLATDSLPATEPDAKRERKPAATPEAKPASNRDATADARPDAGQGAQPGVTAPAAEPGFAPDAPGPRSRGRRGRLRGAERPMEPAAPDATAIGDSAAGATLSLGVPAAPTGSASEPHGKPRGVQGEPSRVTEGEPYGEGMVPVGDTEDGLPPDEARLPLIERERRRRRRGGRRRGRGRQDAGSPIGERSASVVEPGSVEAETGTEAGNVEPEEGANSAAKALPAAEAAVPGEIRGRRGRRHRRRGRRRGQAQELGPEELAALEARRAAEAAAKEERRRIAEQQRAEAQRRKAEREAARRAQQQAAQAKREAARRAKRGATFGETWWSARWTAVLETFGWAARVARGAEYARQGAVRDLYMDEYGVVTAHVQGSRPEPYHVELSMVHIPDEQWDAVLQEMSKNALLAAQLLAGEMPQDIEEVFFNVGVTLFPYDGQEIYADCDCPDQVNPCKHIAAVFYSLAQEFDRDPFLIFRFRGRSGEQVASYLRALRAEAGIEEVEEPLVAEPEIRPLAESLDRFWLAGEGLDTLRLQIAPPVTPGAVLLRLGQPNGWDGARGFIFTMAPYYQALSERALQAAYAESGEIRAATGTGSDAASSTAASTGAGSGTAAGTDGGSGPSPEDGRGPQATRSATVPEAPTGTP